MKKFFEIIKLSLCDICLNKTKSFLSLIGIVIGIMSLTCIVTFGEGGKAKIEEMLQQTGKDIFWVEEKKDQIGFRDMPSHNGNEMGRPMFLEGEDDFIEIKQIAKIENQTEYIKNIEIVLNRNGFCKNLDSQINLNGITPGYAMLVDLEIIKGRFICRLDMDKMLNVCVIDITDENMALSRIKRHMYVGNSIILDDKEYIIVGLVKTNKKLDMYSGFDNITVYIPGTVMENVYSDYQKKVYLQSFSEDRLKEAKIEIIKILRSINMGKRDFITHSFKEILSKGTEMVQTITLVVGGIAFLSLLIGGIGIMNVMFLSTYMRIKDIGTQIAVGARKIDILIQFLSESVILCLIGGIIGIIFGLLIAKLSTPLMELPFIISWRIILTGLLFSISTGVFAGLYPALRASNMNVIEALNYE